MTPEERRANFLKNNSNKAAELQAKSIDVGKPGQADRKEAAKKGAVDLAKYGQHTPAQGDAGES